MGLGDPLSLCLTTSSSESPWRIQRLWMVCGIVSVTPPLADCGEGARLGVWHRERDISLGGFGSKGGCVAPFA